MANQKLVTAADFARMIDASRSTATRAMRGALKAAVTNDRIDVEHDVVREYIEKRNRKNAEPPTPGIDPLYPEAVEYVKNGGKIGVRPIAAELSIGNERAKRIVTMLNASQIKPDPVAKKKPTAKPPEPVPETVEPEPVPDHLEKFADMTLREIIYKFGTDRMFKDYLSALKTLEDIEAKRIRNAVDRGELIARVLVRDHLLDPIDATHRKLMTDGAKNITSTVTAMVAAGKDNLEIEDAITRVVGSFLKPVKNKLTRVLKNA